MKRNALLLAAAAVLLLAASAADPPGFSKLASAFRAAHASGDVQRIAQLVCWDRVEPSTRVAVLHAAEEDMAGSIADIRFAPLDSRDKLQYELHGVTYRPNIRPVGWLVVRFTWLGVAGHPAVSRTQYLIGRKDGRLLIATAAPVSAGGRSGQRGSAAVRR